MAQVSHHNCFLKFNVWRGQIEEAIQVNFLGARTMEKWFSDQISPRRVVQTSYPPFDEEYFEWIGLLDSILRSDNTYTFFELGAGYGRWSVNAALAAMQVGKNYSIFAIEGERTHFEWLRENLMLNNIDASRIEIVHGAIGRKNGTAQFYTGDSSHWYGQRVLFSSDPQRWINDQRGRGVRLEKVHSISLANVLKKYSQVNLIDMDVQGSEFEILDSVKKILPWKVKQVHVGTHSPKIENELRRLFNKLGWRPIYDYSCAKENFTEYGRITFVDGVQGWVNPNF